MIIEETQERRRLHQQRTILFVDEVHRWNKAQQDALLPHVETGMITLIGATTENPYFEVIRALVSRSRIFQLEPLSEDQLSTILDRALNDPERGYGSRKIHRRRGCAPASASSFRWRCPQPAQCAGIGGRKYRSRTGRHIHITLEVAQESIQRRAVLYDKDGDAHYDTISAFIKSVRGSDPDAALYWLAKMMAAGEDPRFILRRLIILAGEDIGLADPMGLVVASAAAQAFDFIGLPEGMYPIVEATLYLATAPKSNSAGAYFKALEIDPAGRRWPGAKSPHGCQPGCQRSRSREGLSVPAQFPGHFIPQQYLPTPLLGTHFYQPSDQGYEAQVAERLERWRQEQEAKIQGRHRGACRSSC